MAFSAILERFIEMSPIPVMVRALLERILTPEKLALCFERVTEKQYTRELLFSSIFELMSLVVTKTFPSINAAYQSQKVDIGVSITSVYNKLNGLESAVSAALVKDTAKEMSEMVHALKGECAPLLPGFRVRMLDGNCIEATEHRLKVLRNNAAGALPGKSLVIYEPALEMATDVFPCEDGHAQERSLLPGVLEAFGENDVIIMDRNFCVRAFLFGIAARGAYAICRHHQQMPYVERSELKPVGDTETGEIYEQWIEIEDEDGAKAKWRRIVIRLEKSTRDGEWELAILTNLPKSAADAKLVAQLYRKRWTIETMFQALEAHLQSEINTLGYPKAALFGFCVALVAYNIMAVVKAGMRAVHGEEKIANEVSGYYIAGEIGRTHEGMTVAILPEEWEIFQTMTNKAFIAVFLRLAGNVKLEKYKKHRRGPKIATPPKTKGSPHVSTAKLLNKDKKSP